MRSAGRIVPSLLRHELLLLGSLLRWGARRPHGLGDPGARAFGYARGQGAMMSGFAFVCVVETVTMSVLLRDFPLAHALFLILDLYTILIVAGLHAASVTRPHVLSDTTLRVRRFATVDLCVPLSAVASVRRELRTTHEKRDGELNLEVGSQTTVTLELAAPVAYLTFLGRRREVRLVRFHADDSAQLVGRIMGATPERSTTEGSTTEGSTTEGSTTEGNAPSLLPRFGLCESYDGWRRGFAACSGHPVRCRGAPRTPRRPREHRGAPENKE